MIRCRIACGGRLRLHSGSILGSAFRRGVQGSSVLDGVPEAERKLCAYAAAVLPSLGPNPVRPCAAGRGRSALKRGASDAVRSRRLHSRFQAKNRSRRSLHPASDRKREAGRLYHHGALPLAGCRGDVSRRARRIGGSTVAKGAPLHENDGVRTVLRTIAFTIAWCLALVALAMIAGARAGAAATRPCPRRSRRGRACSFAPPPGW